MNSVIQVVTDPMCSWCWGMAAAVDEARQRLQGQVTFDLLLGGINTHGTHPVGEFGRRHLMKIWQEVHLTTSQPFGFRLPDALIYNSTLACRAVEAVRQLTDEPPFAYLHLLQESLFVHGVDISSREVLLGAAADLGVDSEALSEEMDAQRVAALVAFQFDTSRQFGTNALPSLLWEHEGQRTLLAGGYLDADMLVTLVTARMTAAASERTPRAQA